MGRSLLSFLALGLSSMLVTACEPPEEPKITPEQCEKLAQRMVTHTVMEKAQNAAQQEELKKELKPKYIEACKTDLPTQKAFACAMAAPNTAAMQQCK